MTLENYIEGLSSMEIKDLIFCIRNFGDRTGMVADENTIKFFRKKYAFICIKRALDYYYSANPNNNGAEIYIQKLRNKLR
jgi:hypothetical protein